MASQLSLQLKKLKDAQPGQSPSILSKGKPSLLFDVLQAASIDLETIWVIGGEGFAELCKMDARFCEFQELLFGTASKSIERELHNAKFNRNLDTKLDALLLLLSPYFLLRPAHKALEWLIRRFRVYQYNVDAVVRCILPFHQTNLFARMVQLLIFKPQSMWSFLEHVQKTGAPLSRQALVQRCLKDLALLEFVCALPVAAADHSPPNRTAISFYGVLITEILGKSSPVSSHLVGRLLPFILKGLKSNSVDYQVASFMIISQLSSSCSLTTEIVESLIKHILQHSSPMIQEDALLCLIFICQTQQIKELSSAVIALLFQFKEFPSQLVSLMSRSYNLKSFLDTLLSSLLHHSTRNIAGLMKIVKEVPVSQQIPLLLSQITEIDQSQMETEEDDSPVEELMRFIQNRYPSELDAFLDAELPTKNSSKSSKRIRNFTALSLKGTRHETLQESSTTLFLSLQHPKAAIRILALENLQSMATTLEKTFIAESILARLGDDTPEVVLACLKAVEAQEVLSTLEPSALLKTLTLLLSGSLPEGVKLAAFGVLTGRFLATYPTFKSHVIPLLMKGLFSAPAGLPFSQEVLKFAVQVQHPFVSNLKSAKLHQLTNEEEWNTSLLHILATNFSTNFSSIFPLLDSFLSVGQFRHIILAVLTESLSGDGINAERKQSMYDLLLPILLGDFTEVTLQLSGNESFEIQTNSSFIQASISLLPIEKVSFLLNCLHKLVSGMQPEDSLFNVSKKIFAAITSVPIRGSLFSQIQQNIFRNLSDSLPRFLAQFWLEEEMVQYPLLLVRSLQLMTAYIASLPSGYDFQFLVPLLSVPLSHQSKMVRRSAFRCLESLGSSEGQQEQKIWGKDDSTKIYSINVSANIHLLTSVLSRKLISAFVTSGQEFFSDCTFLGRFLAQIFTRQSKLNEGDPSIKFLKDETQSLKLFFVSHLLAFDHLYAKYSLLDALKDAPTPEQMILTHPYLKRLSNQLASGPSEFQWTAVQKQIFDLLVRQYSPANLQLLNSPNNDYMATIPQILRSYSSEEDAMERISSVKLSLLSCFTEALWSGLSMENQKTLFSELLGLLHDQSLAVKEKCLDILKAVPVEASILAALLSFTSFKSEEAHSTRSKRRKQEEEYTALHTPATEESVALEFANVDAILELLQHKENVSNPHNLISPLFELLSQLVESKQLEEWRSNIEYTEQLVLATITRYCTELSDSLSMLKEKVPNLKEVESQINLQVVMQSLRTSKNQRSHNAALLLLTAVSHLFPSLVLKQVMQIFTFMGASTLTKDDTYTFQITQKTIQAVVPAVLAGGMGIEPVLAIFVKAYWDIPSHRRVALFSFIAKTLSEQFLHGILLCLFAAHLQDEEAARSREGKDVISLCHELCHEFPPMLVATVLVQLMEVATTLPNEQDNLDNFKGKIPFYNLGGKKLESVISMQTLIVEYVADHISSEAFLDRLLQLSAMEQQSLQKSYLELLKLIIVELQQASQLSSEAKWKAIEDLSTDALENLNSLLSVGSFVALISQLLKHEEPKIRHSALLLLNDKIMKEHESFSSLEVEQFIKLVQLLANILEEAGDSEETNINKQSALLSLEILARNFLQSFPKPFVDLIPLVALSLRHQNSQVIASSAICLATMTAELGPKVLPHASKFFPLLLQALSNSLSAKSQAPKNRALLQMSILSSLEIIITHISNFLTNYNLQILTALTNQKLVEDATNDKVKAKVRDVLFLLAKKGSPRLLLPSLFDSFKHCIKQNSAQPLIFLIDFFDALCRTMTYENVQQLYEKLFKFFFILLGSDKSMNIVEKTQKTALEDHLIAAYLSFVLKLNETMFKPFFLKTFDWAQSKEDPSHTLSRSCFVFKLMSPLADKLKSILVPYFGYTFNHCISLLKLHEDERKKTKEEKQLETDIVINILSSLSKCFLYDTSGFIDKEKFDKLLVVIVDQLDNTSGTKEQYDERTKRVIPCLGQLAVCVGNDALWKPLNYQVLLKTRSPKARVRFAALKVVEECYTRLKEEMLVLLPETIPFLSELMEDSNPEVEKLTKEVIKLIEQFLGADDSISNYL